MNDEQNTPEADENAGKVFLTTDTTLQSQEEFANNKEKEAKDYYEVDDPKKEVHSTIGDGEMHNEGLLGEGNIPGENPFSPEGPQTTRTRPSFATHRDRSLNIFC